MDTVNAQEAQSKSSVALAWSASNGETCTGFASISPAVGSSVACVDCPALVYSGWQQDSPVVELRDTYTYGLGFGTIVGAAVVSTDISSTNEPDLIVLDPANPRLRGLAFIKPNGAEAGTPIRDGDSVYLVDVYSTPQRAVSWDSNNRLHASWELDKLSSNAANVRFVISSATSDNITPFARLIGGVTPAAAGEQQGIVRERYAFSLFHVSRKQYLYVNNGTVPALVDQGNVTQNTNYQAVAGLVQGGGSPPPAYSVFGTAWMPLSLLYVPFGVVVSFVPLGGSSSQSVNWRTEPKDLPREAVAVRLSWSTSDPDGIFANLNQDLLRQQQPIGALPYRMGCCARLLGFDQSYCSPFWVPTPKNQDSPDAENAQAVDPQGNTYHQYCDVVMQLLCGPNGSMLKEVPLELWQRYRLLPPNGLDTGSCGCYVLPDVVPAIIGSCFDAGCSLGYRPPQYDIPPSDCTGGKICVQLGNFLAEYGSQIITKNSRFQNCVSEQPLSNTVILIGSLVGVLLLITAIGLIVFLVNKKSSRKKKTPVTSRSSSGASPSVAPKTEPAKNTPQPSTPASSPQTTTPSNSALF